MSKKNLAIKHESGAGAELHRALRVERSFSGRIPLTEYAITRAGRKALEKYLDHMEALIKAMKGK
ncbi:MAG: transcriptional regulator [Acidobacteria bacterium]|nr:transcriptional regulator [Acidobacteriota bacterium]